MTLTVELTPAEEARLVAAAKQEGVEPAELVRKLMTEHLPSTAPDEETDPTLALFAQWGEEDARKTPEEIAAEERMWEEFEKGINAVRQAQGMRLL